MDLHRPRISIRPAAGGSIITTPCSYDDDYSTERNAISLVNLILIEDIHFGCSKNTSSVNVTWPYPGPKFAMMLPYLGINSPCSEYQKAQNIRDIWGAAGLIFHYSKSDPQNGRLLDPPRNSIPLKDMVIVTMQLTSTDLSWLRLYRGHYPRVSIDPPPSSTPTTFYFIVFAFCILMLLSCLWFLMSYIKRCHNSLRRRRQRVSEPAFG